MFGEIGADERAVLGDLLDGFEEALGIRDLSSIELHRQRLTDFLDAQDSNPRNDDQTEDPDPSESSDESW